MMFALGKSHKQLSRDLMELSSPTDRLEPVKPSLCPVADKAINTEESFQDPFHKFFMK